MTLAVVGAQSQWTTSGSNIYNSNTGNVGIGITIPILKFHLALSNAPGLSITGNSSSYGGADISISRTSTTGVVGHSPTVQFNDGSNGGWIIQGSVANGLQFFWSNPTISWSEWMRLDQNGNLGIGTTTPQAKLDVNGIINTAGITTAGMTIKSVGDNYIQSAQNGKYYNLIGTYPGWDPNSVYIAGYNQYNNSSASSVTKVFISGQNGNQFMFDLSTGNEWIGAPNALPNFVDNYKLNVNGSKRANKVVVNTNGADFVFEPSYKLTPLAKVEEFIKANHHLQGISPANQMQKAGVDVGDNQTKLLQKIEELTLYVIEQDKQQKQQQQLINQQSKNYRRTRQNVTKPTSSSKES